MLTRQLLYGSAGVGKSDYITSSFWDSTNKRLWDETRPGLWVTFGAEDNPTLGIPDIYHKRFMSDDLRDFSWLTGPGGFKELAKGLVAAHRARSAGKEVKGLPIYSIAVDGFSEFDILYQQIADVVWEDEKAKDNFYNWRQMMREFFSIVQILHPVNTGAHLLATARAGEVKKFVQRSVGRRGQDMKTWMVEEQDDFYGGVDVAPSLHGGFKRDLPHYFDYVWYVNTATKQATTGDRKGQMLPVHQYHTMRGGDVYIKNNSERQWLQSKYPAVLENTSFPEVMKILDELHGEKL